MRRRTLFAMVANLALTALFLPYVGIAGALALL
jgi:hypothetical protein